MQACLLLAALCAADVVRVPTSVLDMVPAGADVVLHIPQPGKLPLAIDKLPALDKFLSLAPVREQLDATASRRFLQLVAHFEKSLGAKTPELLDRVAGLGVAATLSYSDKDQPVLLVICGKDELAVTRLLDGVVSVVRDELERAESPEKVVKGEYNGVTGYKVGPALFTRVGATLYLSNNKDALARALDLRLGRAGSPKTLADDAELAEAAKLLPPASLARLRVNMRTFQATPQGKALYASPRDDFLQTILFGGYLDVLGRTPYVCFGLSRDGDEVGFHVRMPRGAEGMKGDRYLHLPPDKEATCLPLLHPKGVLYESSFHMDIASLWTHRDKIFPPAIAKSYADADKNAGPALGGVKLSRLLESAGTSHRFLVMNAGASPYNRRPQTVLPSFAVVTKMRDPERFGRSMETLMRFGALAATQTFKMKIVDESYQGFSLASYRFDEKAESKEDPTDLRFNFTPTFGVVGDSFVACSTLASAKAVIDALRAEGKSPAASTRAVRRDRYYAEGFAELMRHTEDVLIANAILDRAVSPAEAKKQVEEVIALVGGLGGLRSHVEFEPRMFRYDVTLRLRK